MPARFHHGVQDHEQATHAGHQGELGGFAGGEEPLVTVAQDGVVAGPREGRHVQHVADLRAPAPAAPLATEASRIVRQRGDADELRDGAPVQRAELWQMREEQMRGLRADAGDTLQERVLRLPHRTLFDPLIQIGIRLGERLFEKADVLRIVAESTYGSFGLLPNRLDCAAVLVPGILVFETSTEHEVCVAVDQGVLVKTGDEVLVSVRNAIGNLELEQLRAAVEREFLTLDEQEKSARAALSKLEAGFVHRFVAMQHD